MNAVCEFWMVNNDPVMMSAGVAMRLFPGGWKAVTPSGVRADGERISESDFDARVASREALIAKFAAKGDTNP